MIDICRRTFDIATGSALAARGSFISLNRLHPPGLTTRALPYLSEREQDPPPGTPLTSEVPERQENRDQRQCAPSTTTASFRRRAAGTAVPHL
jgi:hypothetical protein